MIHLVYTSHTPDGLSRVQLNDVLNKSRMNNALLQITGALIYRNGGFLQILEGDEEKVKALYDKIAQDSRHKDVQIIAEYPIHDRRFGRWDMGEVSLDTLDNVSSPRLLNAVDLAFTLKKIRDLDGNKGNEEVCKQITSFLEDKDIH